MELRNGEVDDLKVIEVENPNYDEFVGVNADDKIILANSTGFFQFDEASEKFIRSDSLKENKFINYFSHISC